MSDSELSSSAYWESPGLDLRLNPRRPVDVGGLREFLERDLGLRGAVVLATSGSSGQAKFVILSKAAVLASAEAVNRHCALCSEDIWLGGLSTFHVGGLGIYARAYRNGAQVVPMAWDGWTRDGQAFRAAVESVGATLASLTPSHLWDLVQAEVRCPPSLRGVFLGGGYIDPSLLARGLSLGWPLWPTYGMSETASQVATNLEGQSEWLPLLPLWEARTNAEGRLLLRGEALFSGYAWRTERGWQFDSGRDAEGWFATGDRGELKNRALRPLGRIDGAVKVLGELISLPALNERLHSLGIPGWIVALPAERRGHELVLVSESRDEGELERFNAGLPPVEQLQRRVAVTELPRTEVGKPDRERIAALARA